VVGSRHRGGRPATKPYRSSDGPRAYDAGRLVSSLSSVGETVAADDAYDVVIVRHRKPSKIESIDDAPPFRRSKSDFYEG